MFGGWLVAGAVLLVTCTILVVTAGGSGTDAAPAPPEHQSAPADPGPRATADEVADELSRLYPLPHRRDTACVDDGCVSRIVTDRVSITEWSSTDAARLWALSNGGDHAGRFGLSYERSEQQRTADQTRVRWLAVLREDFADR
jgi:hypothetical protein